METTSAIRIPNPSKELVAFMVNAQKRKKEVMQTMRDKFMNSTAR